MAAIMTPKAKATTPVQGGKSVFPEGSYQGSLEEVRTRAFPDWIRTDNNSGYSSADGEIVSIQIGGNTPTEGAYDDPGNMKMFVDFIVRDGNYTIDQGTEIPETSWQMARDAALLTNLALALNLTEEVTDEAGNEFLVTPDDFIEQLQSGAINGTAFGFTTNHRKWSSKGKTGTEVTVTEFFGVE